MIQKGMRTVFNRGDLRGGLLVFGLAVAAMVVVALRLGEELYVLLVSSGEPRCQRQRIFRGTGLESRDGKGSSAEDDLKMQLTVDITEGDTRLSSTIESSVPLPSMNEKQLRQTREATVNSRGEMARKNTCLHCIFYSTRWTGNWPPSRTSSETSQNMKFPPPDSAAGMFSVQDWISSLFSMPLSVRPKVLSQDGHD